MGRSPIHQWGLFTSKPVNEGDMVIEYVGEVIRNSIADLREKYYDSRGIGCYMFKIEEDEIVDATMRGNRARFANHCCQPNCYTRTVTANGKNHIMLFAKRAIDRGEEITYDYLFPIEEKKIPCNCGAAECKEWMN